MFLIFDSANFFLFSWLLFEKPGFQGRIIALEEGPTDDLVNVWAEEGPPTTLDQMGQPVPTAPMVIGSIRLAVRVSGRTYCIHTVKVIVYSVLIFLLQMILYIWGSYDTSGTLNRFGYNISLLSLSPCEIYIL